MAGSKKDYPHAFNKQDEAARKQYSKPKLIPLGSIQTLTLGSGGSSIDGNHTYSQTGRGNDGTGPHPTG